MFLVIAACLVGLLLCVGALGLSVYGRVKREKAPDQAGRASRAALGLAALGVLVSFPLWRLALTGTTTRGEPSSIFDDPLPVTVLFVEALSVFMSLQGVVRSARKSGA